VNNFGINLIGKKVIYKKATFHKPNTTRATRTLICEGGPGCEANGSGILGLLFGPHTISGRWPDGTRDTISSGELEAYIDDNGNEVEAPVEKVKIDAYIAEAPGSKSRADESPVAPAAAPKKRVTEKASKPAPPAAVESTGAKVWDEARIVELFKTGMKVPDIAVEMGYVRGTGQNRTKGVLKKAGLL
jgi:hypothetical protein